MPGPTDLRGSPVPSPSPAPAADPSGPGDSPRIGVLALQGSFALHRASLKRLGVEVSEVRKASQLDGLDGLVLPGGESSTMLKFLLEEGMYDPLREFRESGGALYGTCAGAILLARTVENPTQRSLGLLDLSIRRNGYGRQIDSHISTVACPELGEPELPVVMIRAPVIADRGPGVQVLASHRGQPVLVREGRVLASTFHPELTDDLRVHSYFVEMAVAKNRS